MLAAYPTASDLTAPDWEALMRAATDRIDLLGDTLTPILATPGVPALLATKATHRCHIRILLYDAGRELVPLVDQPGIEIRLLQVPVRYTIHRFDEKLLLTLHLLGENADQAPLVHLRHAAPGGLFERFAEPSTTSGNKTASRSNRRTWTLPSTRKRTRVRTPNPIPASPSPNSRSRRQRTLSPDPATLAWATELSARWILLGET